MSFQASSQEVNPNAQLFSHVPQFSSYDWICLEGLMYQYWKPDTVTAERKRVRQCWYDYRHLHPVMRSFVFEYEYQLAHKRAYKRFYGKPKMPHGDLPIGCRKALYDRSATVIRRTILKMHLVDELCAPYDTFFDAAFDHMMQERGYETYWRQNPAFAHHVLPPLVNLADAASMIPSQRYVEKKNDIKLRLPKHSHYKASNWIGSVSQKECARWLIGQAKRRSERTYALARLTYDLDLLREHEVVRYLGVDEVKKMRSINA